MRALQRDKATLQNPPAVRNRTNSSRALCLKDSESLAKEEFARKHEAAWAGSFMEFIVSSRVIASFGC